MLLRIVLCFIFVFSSGLYGEPDVSQDDTCQTPDMKMGKCVPVNDCKTMIDFINKLSKHIPEETIEEINEYRCGNGVKVIKICCPSEPIEFKKPDSSRPPPPRDVSNHKNLHLLVDNCGQTDLVDKIIGGENAALGEFPWMALLSYKNESKTIFGCGGTVINDRYILTAAHCLIGTSFPLVGVRVGEYDLSTKEDCDKTHKCFPPPQDLTIEKINYPPNYNITFQANDIGLIRVSKINFVENIRAICLPLTEEIRNHEFEYSWVTGWGHLGPDTKVAPPNILQKVEVHTQPLQMCRDRYYIEGINISYKQLCAGMDYKDSCRGDSGGPVLTQHYSNSVGIYVQHGVVSFGKQGCGMGYPAVYTRVAYYMKWILDNLEP